MNEILKKNAINFGILSGIIGITITTLFYLIDLGLFLNIGIGLSILGIWLIIGIILLSKSKRENGGVLTFKQGFTTYFLSAVIGILISTTFNILLFNVFDIEAREVLTEKLIDFQVNMLEKMNTPQEKIAEAIETAKERSQFSVSGQLLGILQSMIGAVIFGLILAAFFKSKNKTQDLY